MLSEPSKSITSTQNSEFKGLLKLKQRRHRNKTQSYLIEGSRELMRAYQAGVVLSCLYVCPEQLSDDAKALHKQLAHIPWIALQAHVFAKLSHREHPEGLMALAKMQSAELDSLNLPAKTLILVLENIEKPGNVGALLRTADAVGADAIVLLGGTDIYNPNVIRASMGSCFSQQIVQLDDGAALITFLEKQSIQMLAASPEAQLSFWQAPLEQATAVILGAEDRGLSAAWDRARVQHVSIPMRGAADSLNVATAGAILLYEALRQRTARL